jgi:hypothetical protein
MKWVILTVAGLVNAVLGQDVNTTFGLNQAVFVVKLTSPLSTQSAKPGDSFTASVQQPVAYQGAEMEGRITSLKRPTKGKGKGRAEIQFEFDRLTLNGRRGAIKADVQQVANSSGVNKVDEEGRVIGTTSKKKRVGATLVGAAAGGAIGAVAAGAGGAAVGAGAGAAAGLLIGVKFSTTGSDIRFAPGSTFTLKVSDADTRGSRR